MTSWNQLSTVDFVASVALSKDDVVDVKRKPNAVRIHQSVATSYTVSLRGASPAGVWLAAPGSRCTGCRQNTQDCTPRREGLGLREPLWGSRATDCTK